MAIFLDTNVLIYAAAGHKSEPDKWAVAQNLLAFEDATISTQVLAEFYAVSQCKRYLDVRDANFWMERLVMMPLVELDGALVLEGVAIAQRYRIHYWDGAILAASQRCLAGILYSEDLNHDQTYGSVRVVNPFLEH